MTQNGPMKSTQRSAARGPAGLASVGGSRARLAEAILSAALDAIIVIDSSGTVLEFNPAACELFGFDEHAAMGQTLASLIIPEELRDAHRAGMTRYLETREGVVLNSRVVLPAQRADGSRLTVELAISPHEDDEGLLFTGWLRDITELEEAREAVTRSEERLAALIANVSDVITVLDSDGSWISSSDAAMRILGHPPGLDPPGGVFSFVHADDLERAEATFRQFLDGSWPSGKRIDLRIRAADGSYRVFETMAEDLRDVPAVNGIVLSSRDVSTERLAASDLAERTTQLSTLVSSLSDGVMFVDSGGRIVIVNQAFTDLLRLGDGPESLRGRSQEDLGGALRHVMKPGMQYSDVVVGRQTSGPPVMGTEITLADGRRLECDYIPCELDVGQFGHLYLYRDVTRRKETELSARRTLAAEVRARELVEEQNRMLRELSDLKSEWVAMVSHDLRTPLTSILTYADLLHGEQSRSERESSLRAIDRNAQRLLRLVDDLLLLGQLESGVLPITPGPFPADRVVGLVVADLEVRARGIGVSVSTSIEDGPPVFGDETRIMQVIENLVSNSLKFAPEVQRIVIAAKRLPDRWVFSVTDDGPGIDHVEHARLFDKFYRVPDKQASSGSGLGLAICRALVELHDGTIWVESSSGAGAQFAFEIMDDRQS